MQFANQGTNDETDSREAGPASHMQELTALPDFNAPLKPVADFVTRPDFPQCVLGEHLASGIGQLPTMGLVAVMVGDDDVEAASALVAELRRPTARSLELDDDEAQLEGDWAPKPA